MTGYERISKPFVTNERSQHNQKAKHNFSFLVAIHTSTVPSIPNHSKHFRKEHFYSHLKFKKTILLDRLECLPFVTTRSSLIDANMMIITW